MGPTAEAIQEAEACLPLLVLNQRDVYTLVTAGLNSFCHVFLLFPSSFAAVYWVRLDYDDRDLSGLSRYRCILT